MKIQIFLKLFKANNKAPLYNIFLNNNKYEPVDNNVHSVVELDIDNEKLLENNILVIEHYGKTDLDTRLDGNTIVEDLAIELEKIIINDIEFDQLMLYLNPFYPVYSQGFYKYAEENNLTIDDRLKTLYFGFNGKYYFQFKKEYRSDYYEKLLKLEENISKENNSDIIADEPINHNSFEILKKEVFD